MNRKTLFQEFIQYVALNVCGMIGLSCYILADTFFVANGIGANGLTALNLAIPIYYYTRLYFYFPAEYGDIRSRACNRVRPRDKYVCDVQALDRKTESFSFYKIRHVRQLNGGHDITWHSFTDHGSCLGSGNDRV